MVRGGGDSNIDDTTDNEDDYINTDSDDDATEDGEEYTNNDTSDDEDESAITSDNNKIDEPQSQQQQDIEERRYQLSSQLSSLKSPLKNLQYKDFRLQAQINE